MGRFNVAVSVSRRETGGEKSKIAELARATGVAYEKRLTRSLATARSACARVRLCTCLFENFLEFDATLAPTTIYLPRRFQTRYTLRPRDTNLAELGQKSGI